MKTQILHRKRFVHIPQVYHGWVLQEGLDFLQIQMTEFIPFGRQNECIRPLSSVIRIFAWVNPRNAETGFI